MFNFEPQFFDATVNINYSNLVFSNYIKSFDNTSINKRMTVLYFSEGKFLQIQNFFKWNSPNLTWYISGHKDWPSDVLAFAQLNADYSYDYIGLG